MTWRDRYPFRQSPRDLAQLVLGIVLLTLYTALVAAGPAIPRAAITPQRIAVFAIVMATLFAAVSAVLFWLAVRGLGGVDQLRLYRRTVRRGGPLPEDADWARWYPRLQQASEVASSDRRKNANAYAYAFGFLGLARLLGVGPGAIWLTLVLGWVLALLLAQIESPRRRRCRQNVDNLIEQIQQVAREERQRHSS